MRIRPRSQPGSTGRLSCHCETNFQGEKNHPRGECGFRKILNKKNVFFTIGVDYKLRAPEPGKIVPALKSNYEPMQVLANGI